MSVGRWCPRTPRHRIPARNQTRGFRRERIAARKYLTARPAPCRAGPRPVTSRRRAREADPPGDTRPEGAMFCDGRAARAREPRDAPSGASLATPRRETHRFSQTRAKPKKSVQRDSPPAFERRGGRANRAGVERTISAAARGFSSGIEPSARVASVAPSTCSSSPELVLSRVGAVPPSARIVASGATSGAVDANVRRDDARGIHAIRSLRDRSDVRRGRSVSDACAAQPLASQRLRVAFYNNAPATCSGDTPTHKCRANHVGRRNPIPFSLTRGGIFFS